MNSILKKIAVAALVVSVAVISGCASLSSSGGGSADTALMGDLLTERSVYRALFTESALSDSSILVGCVDGVITLTGVVDSDVERQLAERLAAGVNGVSSVNNGLTTRT